MRRIGRHTPAGVAARESAETLARAKAALEHQQELRAAEDEERELLMATLREVGGQAQESAEQLAGLLGELGQR